MTTPGLTTDSSVEILSAYTATNQNVPAVAAAPGWQVVGATFLPVSAQNVRLEVLGAVSDASLVMTLRLFDLTAVAPVSGSDVQITSVTDQRATSGVFGLTGGREYQWQAQVVGGAGVDLYGSMKSSTLI